MRKLKQLGKILWGATSMALLTFAFSPVFLNAETASSASDCDDNAVIYCGFSSKTQLVNTIANGDGRHSDIKSKFGAMGIYANDISGANTYDGTVKKDGTVWVGSTQVASGVYSAGRSNMASSTYWNGLYWRSPSISFNSDALSAYVYMYKGAFKYAIIKSCGNPVLKQLAPITPGLYLVKDVSNLNSDPNWKDYNEGKPGDTLKYSIHVTNNSAVTAEGVTVWDVLPNHISLVSGSAQVHYGSSVTNISDSTLTKGVRIGNFTPGTDAYVTFKVTIKNDFSAGTCQHVTNTGFAKSDYTKETSDKAYTNVCVTPPSTTTTTKPVTTTTKPVTTTTKPVTTTTKPVTTTTKPVTTTTTKPCTTTTTSTTTKPTTTTTTKPTYELKVKKFEDKNRDGDHDLFENWLSGWTFDVVGPHTSRLITTGNDGTVTLSGLSAGTYTVTEHQKSGWGPTEESKLIKIIEVGSGNKTIEFGNYKLPVDQKYTITVNKFEDLDADTKKDENEALLSGWEFTLKGEGIEITEKTNASGSITFEGLKAGTYTISENLQAGWRATTNAAQKVTVGPDRIVWFGNQRIPVTTTTKPVETPILPVTGPFQIFAGLAGTFGLGSSALFYRRSRKTVLKSLRSL